MNLLVLCPTRGRPGNALELQNHFLATRDSEESELLFVVDNDDPYLEAYVGLLPAHRLEILMNQGGMVTALNVSASRHASECSVIGFVGDDHRFRTKGWDTHFSRVLAEHGGGFAYGSDQNWPHGEIPTQIFISSVIVQALGWMGLPTCKHLYIDNVWRVLGEAVDRLFYFPEVIIEHMHPYAGKAPMDAQYAAVNSPEVNGADHAAFEAWTQGPAHEDIETVRRALGI